MRSGLDWTQLGAKAQHVHGDEATHLTQKLFRNFVFCLFWF